MFNHVRTLLANAAPRGGVPLPGEVLVPAGFAPVRLTQGLAAVRAAVFGTSPDRHMLAARLSQCMPLVHASPLGPLALAADPRLTYDPGGSDAGLAGVPEAPSVSRSRGLGTPAVLGDPSPPDRTGVCRFMYEVAASGGRAAVVVTTASLFPETKDLPGPVPLRGSGYSLLFDSPDADGVWFVEAVNRPAGGPGQVVASVELCGEPALFELFGSGPSEPYASFRNAWHGSRETPTRLAAALLALAARTDERRALGA